MIREVNKEKRLKWAKDNEETTFENVIFMDETSVQKLTGAHVATSEGASHTINPSLSIL